MTRRLPPLTWLRSFEAAARHLSFTAAGDELGLTQAAVSQHIKALEQALGQPLFIRLTRSLKLTDAGDAYLRMLQPLLDRIADGTDALFGSGSDNRLTIRANAAFSVLWLAPRLSRFYASHPDIDIRISNPVWAVTDLDEGADFEIRYGDGEWPGMTVEPLTRDRLFPVAAPGTGEIDLTAARLIHVMGYRDGWREWLAAAGIDGVDHRRGLQCDNSIMAFEAAADGAGVAIARTSLVAGHLTAGRLVRPFDAEHKTAEEFFLVAMAGRRGGAARDAFRDWLLAEAAHDTN